MIIFPLGSVFGAAMQSFATFLAGPTDFVKLCTAVSANETAGSMFSHLILSGTLPVVIRLGGWAVAAVLVLCDVDAPNC